MIVRRAGHVLRGNDGLLKLVIEGKLKGKRPRHGMIDDLN